MQDESRDAATGVKKPYEPPRLLLQDHMVRVYAKTTGGDDQNIGNFRKTTQPVGEGPGDLTGDNSSGEAGSLFDNLFDD